jgi:hypothetical protein
MRNTKNHLNASARRLRIGLAVAASALAVCVLPAAALGATVNDTTQFGVNAGTLGFGSNPDIATLSSVALSGQAQTTQSNMANFAVADATGSGSGWNVTVIGDSSGGHSAVFKQYCSNGASACGADAANSYVSAGQTLAANSLTLNSTSAGFTAQNGTTGTAPTHSCNAGCFVDSASPVKLVSAAANAGMGTYQANSYTATSLALNAPSTVKSLPANEVYRLDLVTTVNSGP